jgi:hypothetical protein
MAYSGKETGIRIEPRAHKTTPVLVSADADTSYYAFRLKTPGRVEDTF